jgi:alkanesulfonate monooxygenase SsuD/methylene tetrahydromethanopterin reductase-like flavin-dependent oxidoreductase (luciferase family)
VKVNLSAGVNNREDWDRVQAAAWDRSPATPDAVQLKRAFDLLDLAEPLGFDGIWAAQHFGTPYGLTPNPLQLLSYYAGRTQTVKLGTMVLVLPWWSPVQVAHEIAYLDIISNGRFDTIGFGRGVARSEFDALGIPREEARQRFEECLEIITLALTTERFSFEGQIFKIPEMSLRPQPVSKDLTSRFYGASATNTSLEVMARKGLKPLFVGNKPLSEAANDVRLVNGFRKEEGLAPCQSKNILFMYCAPTKAEAAESEPWIQEANRAVLLHYGFGDPNSFTGVKGYEAYAAGQASATAVTAGNKAVTGGSTYDSSNLLIGTPDEIIRRIQEGQKACSFSEITIGPAGGTPAQAEASLRLFAKEVLPVIHKMEAPLHAAVLPEPVTA